MQTTGSSLGHLARRIENHPAVNWYTRHWSAVLLTIEALVASFFIYYGPLHPIDYPTYLHQARTFTVDHDLDYTHMRGPTGKLVYPALHLYIFSAFERFFGIPEHDLQAAPWVYPQLIFLALLLVQTNITHHLYARISAQPHWDCLFFLFTVRARNVYVNGLFNDGVQVIFVHAGLLALARNKSPALVLLLLSISASIKMNALLWGPGLAVHYISTLGIRTTLRACQPAVAWQLLVGLPFLAAHPVSYLSRSFQLNREFVWFNSVYWKWLPPSIFYSSAFHVLLQLCHLGLLAVFAYFFLTSASSDQLVLPKVRPLSARTIAPDRESPRGTITFLATMHFAGIAFAKSLHYSFYIWYFHTLPILYSAAHIPWLARPLLATLLEVSWNQWYSYKGRLANGSVDQLNSCGSWRGGLGIFVAHMTMVVMLIRRGKSSKARQQHQTHGEQ